MSKTQMVGDSFRLGFRFQRHWDIPMASAFFCGELGAGLYFVSMIHDFTPGLVLGLLITGVGKPFFHLTHMGVPAQSWRAVLRPDRSWTSRGLIAIVVFSGAGALHTINVISGNTIPFDIVFQILAGAAALIVMTYQGFAMSHSTAIALWSTAMMPVSSLFYALTGGVIVTLLLQANSLAPEAVNQLIYMALGLLLADLVMLLGILRNAYRRPPGGRLSAELLTKTLYAKWFHGAVLVAGILLPLAALSFGSDAFVARLLAAAGVLAGFYAFRVLIFKAGVYEPVMSFSSQFGAQNG